MYWTWKYTAFKDEIMQHEKGPSRKNVSERDVEREWCGAKS